MNKKAAFRVSSSSGSGEAGLPLQRERERLLLVCVRERKVHLACFVLLLRGVPALQMGEISDSGPI